MKKFVLILILCLLSFIIVACDTEDDHDDDDDSVTKKKIPTQIFNKQTTNDSISEKTMKQDIQLYLDTDRELTDAKFYYMDIIDSDDKLTTSQQDEFAKLMQLTDQNDQNFARYIHNNVLPKGGYDKFTNKISEYTKASNKIDKKSYELSKKDDASVLDDIKQLNEDRDVVNGREQKKIEKFLKAKGIKTKAYD